MTRAIRTYLRDFLAVILLVVIAVAAGSFILSKQRLTLPGWVPFVGTEFFVLEAEFSTAQAVTPGQGQTVDIAGVPVGEISKVRLRNGRAILTLRMDEEWAGRVHTDATALLRPKTGLKDMVVALEPGTRDTPALEEGDVIPVGSTLPDVNFDEILAALDGDTRTYLRLLLAGGGEGLRDNGPALGDALRRFEPTARDLRRINTGLAVRKKRIRGAIHNFSLLTGELGSKDDQIAEFVDNQAAFFRILARQQDNVQATLQELPTALDETQQALGATEALASELGPALEELRPGARALGPSLVAVQGLATETLAPIRDEIRPFTSAAQPTVRALQPAVSDLAQAAPELTSSFETINYLFNTLAHNPKGAQDEGYLFWLSWFNHLGGTLFSNQDAHGPIRRGIIVASCLNLNILGNVARASPPLGTLVGLLNPPDQTRVCARGGSASRAAKASSREKREKK